MKPALPVTKYRKVSPFYFFTVRIFEHSFQRPFGQGANTSHSFGPGCCCPHLTDIYLKRALPNGLWDEEGQSLIYPMNAWVEIFYLADEIIHSQTFSRFL